MRPMKKQLRGRLRKPGRVYRGTGAYKKKQTRLPKSRKSQKARLRRRKILLVKLAASAVMLFAAFLIILAVTNVVRFFMNKPTESNVAQQVTEAAVIPENTTAAAVPGITVNYPTISPSYKTIASDKVLSPYIALLDIENDSIIAGREYNQKIYPASMTKVMTLIVAVEQIKDVNATFTMTNEILYPLVQQNATRAGFDPGEKCSAVDMFYGLILPSGADAAAGLAQMISGTEDNFAALMNKKCQEMGLKNTHFTNASGLYNDNQYTTPMEMALIMEYAMKDETCAKVLSTYQYTTRATEQHPEGIPLTSTMFSRMYGTEVEGVTITAGKVGYTIEAGNCLVSYAVKGDEHYVAVTGGATNKWHSIYDAFEIYRDYTLSD